jgi:DNA-binding response OmpR family regulator
VQTCGHVLIVDDDPAFGEGVRLLLERGHLEARCVGTGGEGVAAAVADRPGLVLLDVNLPDLSGYEVCQELRRRFGEELPIIFVSGDRTASYDRVAGLMLGADDYVVKPFEPSELLARVRTHLRRGEAHRRPVDGTNGSLDMLTAREREVLALLAGGLEQAQIAQALFITPNTVAKHIQSTLGKLDVHSRAQAVAYFHGSRDGHADVAAHLAEPLAQG